MSSKQSANNAKAEQTLCEVRAIAKDGFDYLSLFPGTGLCLNTLGRILNAIDGHCLPPEQPLSNQLSLLETNKD